MEGHALAHTSTRSKIYDKRNAYLDYILNREVNYFNVQSETLFAITSAEQDDNIRIIKDNIKTQFNYKTSE